MPYRGPCEHLDCICHRAEKQGMKLPFPDRLMASCDEWGRLCRGCGHRFCAGSPRRPNLKGYCGYCRFGRDMPIVFPNAFRQELQRRINDEELPF